MLGQGMKKISINKALFIRVVTIDTFIKYVDIIQFFRHVISRCRSCRHISGVFLGQKLIQCSIKIQFFPT